MEVSKERLSIIGKMMGIYREERRANTQNSWTQKRFCKDVCSANTLKNIEKGELARSNDVYCELLAKFDLKLGEFPTIDKAMVTLTNQLYDAIEYYRLDDIFIIIEKILRVLDKVHDYIYYSELCLLFERARCYYKQGLFIESIQVERFKEFMYIYPEIYSDIFRFLIYAKVKASGVGSKDDYGELVLILSLEESHHNFVKTGLIDFYYIMGKYKTMENLIDELIDTFTKENKIIRLLDVYNYAIVLLSNIEYKKCKEYIKQSEIMVGKENVPDIKKSDLYSNIAVAYQINEEYMQALTYFKKMISIEHGDFIDSYIFMADCQNHLNIPVDIPIVDECVYSQYPNDVKLMYKYFTYGLDIPNFVKENYIIKKILPNLTDHEYIKIFRFEISKLVSHTGHYKAAHLFNQITEDNKKRKVDGF